MNPFDPAQGPSATPDQFLQRVRAGSCYGTLRAVVELVAILGWIGAFILANFGLLTCLSTEESRALSRKTQGLVGSNLAEINLAVGILLMVFAAVAAVLITAWRQSQLLKADIADVLIEAHRHRLPDAVPQVDAVRPPPEGSIAPWILLAIVIVAAGVWFFGRT
jgi:hypothetical protein